MSESSKALWAYVQENNISVEQAEADYIKHKKVCKMPYDPYRVPRQCPECGRLIEIVAIAECLLERPAGYDTVDVGKLYHAN